MPKGTATCNNIINITFADDWIFLPYVQRHF